MKYLTEEKLKDFRNKFGDLFHYPNMIQWIENEINLAVSRAQQQVKVESVKCDLPKYLERQKEWSIKTFGNGKRTLGITKHIQKELKEIEEQPNDLTEWIDVVILALDGYWRHGGELDKLMEILQAKQDKNFARVYPFPKSEDEPSEHDRSI